MEIERKFLVNIDKLPDLNSLIHYKIEQFYTDFNPIERYRKVIHDDNYIQYFITIKRQSGLIREEEEYAVSEIDYKGGLSCIKSNIIKKERYEFVIDKENELIAEIDFFEKLVDKKGNKLITVEVEFDTEKDALNFIPLDWFGEELTYDEYYKNNNLSKL